MRKIIFGAALPVLLAMSGAAAAAPAPAWTVSEASGDVRLVENGKTRAARRGALLSSGSIIATGANARAVIVRGKEFVVVSPRSQIRVPAPAEARGGIIQMIADYGTALFRIEKKSTPHFGVRTPYLAAVVKGTTFTVNVGEAGGSVQVTEGAVEVSTLDGGAAELVRPGTVAMVGASDLYRLSLEGGETRSIRSDAAPAQGTVTSSVVPAAKPALHFGPAPQASLIAHAVAEHGQSLSQLTDGLLDGPSRADVVLAELSNQGKRVGRGDADDSAGKPASPPGKPADPGKSGEKPDTGNGSGGDAGKPDTGKPDGAKPPANDGKDTPPAGDGKGAPPADDGKDKPPADDGKGAPPPANDGKSTPPADGGKDKPPADDGKSPPPADGGKDKPPADVVKDKPADPPATDLPPPPPPADSGKDKPPADDGKDKPADPPAPDLPPLLPPVDGGKEKPAGPPATDLPPPLPPIDGGKGEPASPPATDLPPPPSLPEIDPVDVPSLPPPGPDDDSSGSGDDDDADDDGDDDDADGGLSVCVLGICVGGGGDDD